MKRHDYVIYPSKFLTLGKLVYLVEKNLPEIQPYPLPDTLDETSDFMY